MIVAAPSCTWLETPVDYYVPYEEYESVDTQPLSKMIDVSSLIFRGKVLYGSGYRTWFVLQDIIKQPGSLKIGDEYTIDQEQGKYYLLPYSFRKNEEYVVFLSGAKSDTNVSAVPFLQKRWFPQAVFIINRDNSIISVSNGRPVTELAEADFSDEGYMLCAPVLLNAITGKPEHIELGRFTESVRKSINTPCVDRDI
jgi:hypothetical protein